jgi:hypothetical protein
MPLHRIFLISDLGSHDMLQQPKTLHTDSTEKEQNMFSCTSTPIKLIKHPQEDAQWN